MSRFVAPKMLRGVFAGAGSDGLSQPVICDAILQLTGKPSASDVTVGYLGTATYDLPMGRSRQTGILEERGCKIVDIAVSDPAVQYDKTDLEQKLKSCDVVIVSGGNTLYAMDRWKLLGIDGLLAEARDR